MPEKEQDEQNTRLLSDLSEEEREKIADYIRRGSRSYRQILREFHLKNLSAVHSIKKKYVEGGGEKKPPKPRTHTKRTKEKIRESVIAHKFIESADLIVGKHVDVLEGIIWGIKNLQNITEEQRSENQQISTFLEKLSSEVEKFKTFTKEQEKEKNRLIRDIYLALGKVSQFVYGKQLMINAIDKLRGYLSLYNEQEIEIKVIKEVSNMLFAFFEGAQLLPEEYYQQFKAKVIELSRFSERYFIQYETPPIQILPASTEHSNEQNN